VTASDQLQQDHLEELIHGNRHIKQKETAIALGISKERVGHIIGVLGLRKVCARGVLSDEMKAERTFWNTRTPIMCPTLSLEIPNATAVYFCLMRRFPRISSSSRSW
jgi:hypothetical protein